MLDDCSIDSIDPRSRLYTGYARSLICVHATELPSMLEQMLQALVQGQFAVALFDYELGAVMHGIALRSSSRPLAQILLFDHCEKLSETEVAAWLAAREQATGAVLPNRAQAGIANLHSSVGDTQFNDAVSRIHRYLEAGDSYQVNYTYRLRFDAYGSPCALYRRLRASQPVPFGALIALPDGGAVLSLSPELFVRHAQRVLTAQPMKGTAAASGNAQQDAARALQLTNDPKNRAENLMIVDLLRNDLGRVAALGSVQVPRLFDVDRYGAVLQMTSTVQAQLRDDVTLDELLRALYPCGSITGAPKRRSMQIIRELEPNARGLYTGAIGWFDAPAAQHHIGDFCLSVPIRTLLLAPQADGIRVGEMGVGAGIVHDSDAAAEYAECRLKARFLTDLQPDFELLETMQATSAGCRYLERHLQRLLSSAAYFGFVCDEYYVRGEVRRMCDGLPLAGIYRLRLALNQQGACAIQTAPLLPSDEPVKLLIALQPTSADDLFLRHKTTVRAGYDAAWRTAEAHGAFDALFCNTQGKVTEGARTNLFVKLGRRWVTPPLSAGVLPGVMRAVLLNDPAWNAYERHLSLQDVRDAEQVVVCNALRGALRAVVDWNAAISV